MAGAASAAPSRVAMNRFMVSSVEKVVGHEDVALENAARGAHERGATDLAAGELELGYDAARRMLDADRAPGQGLRFKKAVCYRPGQESGACDGERSRGGVRAVAGEWREVARLDVAAIARARDEHGLGHD